MNILGINNGHDSSAAIIVDGKVVAMSQEERITKIKHYFGLPTKSIEFCLKKAGLSPKDLDYVTIPTLKKTIDIYALFNKSVSGRMVISEFEKFSLNSIIRKSLIYLSEFMNIGNQFDFPAYQKRYQLKDKTELVHVEHHQSHAASAYFSSGFDKCLVVTLDGAGDASSASVWIGESGKLKLIERIGRNGSLGFFYNIVTEALGWQVSEGEGKVMGLAPYGNTRKTKGKLDFFLPKFKNGKLDKPTNFGFPNFWIEGGNIHWHFWQTKVVMDLIKKYGREDVAAEAQRCLEIQSINFIKPYLEKYGLNKLAVAGGVFLNVKLNQRIWEKCDLEDYFIFPDSGDAGISVGSALDVFYQKKSYQKYTINDTYWGSSYTDTEIKYYLDMQKIKYRKLSRKKMIETVSKKLSNGKIVAWYQGKMEAGPRALGNRSILMDPRYAKNKDIINNTVKFREPFRPFCPSMTPMGAKMYLKNPRKAPFMIISFDGTDKAIKEIPAVVHVDGTLRPQIVEKNVNSMYFDLITSFGEITGVPVLLNTSFNIKGEPIVESPRDAIKCFYDTGLDALAIGSFFLEK